MFEEDCCLVYTDFFRLSSSIVLQRVTWIKHRDLNHIHPKVPLLSLSLHVTIHRQYNHSIINWIFKHFR